MTDLGNDPPRVPMTRNPTTRARARLEDETDRDARARALLDDGLAAVHVEEILRLPGRRETVRG